MQSSAIITENPSEKRFEQVKIKSNKSNVNGNYLILSAIVLFCLLLLLLGFPFFMVFIFGMGMSFVLILLYLIRGIQIVLELDEKELEEAIWEDLFV